MRERAREREKERERETETETKTDIQTERQRPTNRQTNRQTDRQTRDIQTNTQKERGDGAMTSPSHTVAAAASRAGSPTAAAATPCASTR